MDILWDFHTPRMARSVISTGTKMDEKYLFMLQSCINQTAEDVYPESACAPNLKSIFPFLVLLVSESGEIRLLEQKILWSTQNSTVFLVYLLIKYPSVTWFIWELQLLHSSIPTQLPKGRLLSQPPQRVWSQHPSGSLPAGFPAFAVSAGRWPAFHSRNRESPSPV